MIKPDLSKWDYVPELEGLLFFAQSLQEMLFHHTVDTFKAPALNVHTTLFELLYIANQVNSKHIRDANLDYVIEEFSIRLQEDPVLGSEYSKLYKYYIDEINNSRKNPSEIIRYCGSLNTKISGYYWENLINLITEKVGFPKEKKELSALAASFVAEAELQNFSREYIYFRTNQFFFEDTSVRISSVNQVKDFLSCFQNTSSEWQVFFKGSSNFEELNRVTNQINTEKMKIEISSTPPKNVKPKTLANQFFRLDPVHPQYISITINKDEEVKEAISARDSAKNTLDLLSTIYSFSTHKEIVDINDQSMIINKSNSEYCVLKERIHQMKCGIPRLLDQDLDAKISLFLDIFNQAHFDYTSTNQIYRSISFHHAALESKFLLNQLVDLWAALEGLLPNPDEGSSRIEFYLDCILPSQVISYPMKIFSDVCEDLSHEEGLKDIIEKSVDNMDFYNKTITVLVTNECKGIREQLYSALDYHPLLRNRICYVNQSFGTNKHIRNTLILHRGKLKRHIQRIYNCRNQIVHNATTLPYISTLVENLHSYIDTLLESILTIAVNSRVRLSISSALGILSIQERQLFACLDGEDQECSIANHKDFLGLS